MKRFLTALLIITLTATPALCQEGLLKVRINDFFGGMNSNDSEDTLKENQGASMVNVVINRAGKISKRKGQNLFVTDVGNTAFTGLGRFDPDATTSYMLVASGTNVAKVLSSSAEWSAISPVSIFTTGKTTEFVQANDQLFIINGYDNTSWYDGSSLIQSNFYPPSPPTASTGAWLRNYLFLAGATIENDWVYFSNNLEPDVYTSGDIIKINTGDGQKVQHLEPYRLNELIIYKERSVFVLDITGATPLTDWTVQPISTVIGTPAPRSVVSLGNDQWFLSSEPIAVRSLVRTEFDKILVNRVSQPIQDIFDGTGDIALNKTNMRKSAAVLYDDKYILAIPTGTSLVNNTVVVFDFFTQSWYRINGWFPADWVKFDNRLFYIDANDGRAIEVFTGTDGDYLKGPNFIDSSSTPSVGISFEYITKTIDFDNPENFKSLEALEVEFEPTGDYEAIVYTDLDKNGWVSAGSVNLAGNSLTLSFTLPSVLDNEGISRKTFQLQDRGEFKKMQIRVSNTQPSQEVILKRITSFARPRPWRKIQP